MVLFLRQYGYLASALMLLAVFLSGVIACPKQRVGMLLSACLGAPLALFAFFFVPDYWNPIRVVPFRMGPEDVIFSFSNGGTVWLLAVWLVRDRIKLGAKPTVVLERLVSCALPCLLLCLALRLSGATIMTSVLFTMSLLGVFLAWRRRDLLRISLAGAVGFVAFYFLFVNLVLTIWPECLRQWNAANLSGRRLFRVPLEEVAWAVGYGFVWPLLTAYVLDAELVPVPRALAPRAPEAVREK
jgi:hypothetical protein